jgi:hypothetical protein
MCNKEECKKQEVQPLDLCIISPSSLAINIGSIIHIITSENFCFLALSCYSIAITISICYQILSTCATASRVISAVIMPPQHCWSPSAFVSIIHLLGPCQSSQFTNGPMVQQWSAAFLILARIGQHWT